MPEQDQPKILLLRHLLNHINHVSGYENFTRALAGTGISYAEVFRLRSLQRMDFRRKLLLTRKRKLLANQIGPFYNPFSFIAEMDALRVIRRIRPAVVHNTFLEDNHGYLGHYKSTERFALIGTSHQPLSWWKFTQKPTRVLDQLDQLITVSSAEAAFFDRLIPGRVTFLRHGVDTDFFRIMTAMSQRPKRVLFVGSWMRDAGFFADAVNRLLIADPGIKIDIVYSSEVDVSNPLFGLCRHSQVDVHRYISNEALRELFNQSRLLFLPLKDSTANNAVLEAMACGLPIVTNQLPGIADYTTDAFCFMYRSMEDCVEYILRQLDDESSLATRSLAAREWVVTHCSLEQIAAAHMAVYRQFF